MMGSNSVSLRECWELFGRGPGIAWKRFQVAETFQSVFHPSVIQGKQRYTLPSFRLLVISAFLAAALVGRAATTVYYDESSFLNAVSVLGYSRIAESFEDSVWGPARGYGGTNGAIISQGITWAAGELLAAGPYARSGNYSIHDLTGDPDLIECISYSPRPITALGGWFYGSCTNLVMKASPYPAGELATVASTALAVSPYRFLGVINPSGFSEFAFTTTSPNGGWAADDFTIAFAPPKLTQVRLQGGQVRIAWPTNAMGYVLESATNLAAPAWTAVTNVPVASGAEFRVNFDSAAEQRFFRLRQP
jgi:hypothetical protein